MKAVTSVPSVSVSISGGELGSGAMACLESVRVQECLGLPSQLELVFSDPVDDLLNDPPSPGADILVRVGQENEPLFTGELSALEIEYGPGNQQQLRIRGYDRLRVLARRWSVRAHVQTSLHELINELTDGLGVSVETASRSLSWPRMIQTHQSDFELLTELTAQVGLYPYLYGSVLKLVSLQGYWSSATLELGRNLLEAQFEANVDPESGSVSVSGWDPLKTETHTGIARDPERGYDVDAGHDLSGSSGTEGYEIADRAAMSNGHLDSIARAHLEHRAARMVVFRGVADGQCSLRPGARVEITNVAEKFTGTYTLSTVTHTLDSQHGYLSSLSTFPPPLHDEEQHTRIGIGRITQVNDPENAGRVRVMFPTFDNIESEWLQVMSPGAGAGKGLMIVPEVDDVVLVLFAHGLPGQAIVLGGLYGLDGPVDPGIHEDRVSRYTMRTRGGQLIRLDDDERSLTLETADGNRVQLTPDLFSLVAATDLDIAAPGKRISIRGEQIDFERS